jgi:uncharacterized protein YqeY
MKAKEADKLAALRNIRAAFLKETKEVSKATCKQLYMLLAGAHSVRMHAHV